MIEFNHHYTKKLCTDTISEKLYCSNFVANFWLVFVIFCLLVCLQETTTSVQLFSFPENKRLKRIEKSLLHVKYSSKTI